MVSPSPSGDKLRKTGDVPPSFRRIPVLQRSVSEFWPAESPGIADQFDWCIAPFSTTSGGVERRYRQNVSPGRGERGGGGCIVRYTM